jgi:predicted TIM-barrel fold metal-dependent hydrolase
MVVDFHTHIFPPSFRDRREELSRRDATFCTLFSDPRSGLATAEELVLAMDQARVDVAVAMGVGWNNRDVAAEANDYILQAAGRFPSRIVAFCSVNPSWGPEAVKEVERCAAKGAAGIGELHPDTQGFNLGDASLMAPLMHSARTLGLVLLTHSSEPVGHRYPGKGRTTPEVLYSLASSFPQNTLVLAHWGGGLPFYGLMPEVKDALARVYYDTAASPLLYRPEVFPVVAGLVGPERVLFGTDFPLIKHGRLMKQIAEAPIPDGARAGILGENARALLGLKAGP